jgi:prevent-host-death family protein
MTFDLDQLDQPANQAQNQDKGKPAMAAKSVPRGKESAQPAQVNLYEAKTQLSSLVERVATGEEIVIAKAGKPMARLVPLDREKKLKPRRTLGQNFMGITYIAEDFDAPLPEDVLRDFGM